MAQRLLMGRDIMLRNLCLIAIFSFSTAFAVACGDSEQQPDKQPNQNPPPPALTYCDGYVRGCERQVECGVVVYNHAATKEECLAQTGCALVATATLSAQGIELDKSKIDLCKTKIDTLSCEELSEFRGGAPRGLDTCASFTRGTLDEGEACSSLGFEACKDGMTCDFGDATCPGACKAIPVACTQTSCEAGEYCSYQSGECVALALEGELCEPNMINDLTRKSCANDLHCFAEFEQDARCTVRVPLGDACDVSLDVELCAVGSYCSPESETPTCVARVGVGETCNFVGMCNEDLYCDFASNTCAVQKKAGETCNDSAGACELGYKCDETCKLPGDIIEVVEPKTIAREGEECGVGIVCGLGTICAITGENEAKCAAARAPGEECEAAIDAFACAKGLCNFNTNECPEILEVGDTCAPDGLYTGCPLALCLNGKCAAADELVCEGISG